MIVLMKGWKHAQISELIEKNSIRWVATVEVIVKHAESKENVWYKPNR